MPDERTSVTADSRLQRLTCREVVELITAYLEAALDERERALVSDHLAICSHCSRYLEQMRQTAIWLSEQRGNGVSPEVKAELLDRFRRWRSNEPG
jgi:predicted anti-sigma-YlaC factor YlaD